MNAYEQIVQRCQSNLAMLYRSRARKALQQARNAAQSGDQAAVCRFVRDACFWRVAAHKWASNARTPVRIQVERLRPSVGHSVHA